MSSQKLMQRMNLQRGMTFANGYSTRRVDTMMGTRTENKTQARKSASPNFVSANGTRVGRPTSPSRDRLIYVLTCLVGHHVEVHVKNGSIISGIFHATNADGDFEIVLKMAQVIKDGSVRERKSDHDTIKKPQPMVIPARELVQVLAKDVSLSSDEFTAGQSCEKQKDLMTDSVISHSHHLDMARELAPWMPDEEDPECPELENIFDGSFDRKWDQFETNEALFGVKSTFNEELYTTKLERGPQMRDLEKLALKIAREIEGEETQDLHLAEERGFSYHDDFDLDEESRYSAVRREVNGTGCRENENSDMEAYGSGIFAGSLGLATSGSCSDSLSKQIGNESQASSTSSSVVNTKHQQIFVSYSADINGLRSTILCACTVI
ncbi:hypothetical protein B296_00026969 [Ensete ventricosum]|uniref:LsmAD domain-containing protein n=1 Tax=Ensete ventricosum TaxID=4639 RepID=A0A427A4E1_ENSVE|nr:hypothetical protein B296_00026969 [Ensete ventricosum]